MSLKRLIAGLIVLATLVAVVWWLSGQASRETGTPADTDSAPVPAASVDGVAVEGRIVPLRHTGLAFQTSGQVAEILVQEGDVVQTGDPLVRLDPKDQEIAVKQAEADLAQAKADVETANAGLLGAQTALVGAQLAAKSAEVQLALARAGPLPEEVAVLERAIDVATANITHTLANRDMVLEGPRDTQIRAAEAGVKEAYVLMLQARHERDELNQREDVEDDEKVRAQMQLNAAIVNLDAAEAALDELLAGATADERRAAEAAVTGALAQREGAQAQLDKLLAGAKPEQITVAEARVEQAAKAIAEAELATVSAGQAMTAAEARVAQAQAALDAAGAALERLTLTAPFDGTVADIAFALGETASAGVPAVTLADMTGWLVETIDLSELDVASVALGDRVEVEVDALSDRVLGGTFTAIAPVSRLVRGDVTYAVTVRLDDLELENGSKLPLRWGMTAYVQLEQ